MAREERELEELGDALESVVGPRQASTLMRHLSPVPAVELATKTDIRDLRDEMQDLREEMRDGFRRIGELFAGLDNRLTRLEAGIDVDMAKVSTDMANLEQRMLARMNAHTITLLSALATIVVAITTLAFFR